MTTKIPTELQSLARHRRPSLFNAAEYWLRYDRFTRGLGALGDRFVVTMPGSGAWLGLTDPDDIARVFRAESGAVYFAEALRMLSPHELVTGPTVLTSLDGSPHLGRRRALLPLFHGDALKRYEPTMEAKAHELAAAWPTGAATRAHDQAGLVTLEIIMAVVFGVTDRGRLDRLREAILALTAETTSRRFVLQMAISNARSDGFSRPVPRIEARKAAIDAIVLEEIADRRRLGEFGERDLLGRLLAGGDDGDRLSDREICDELRLLMLAGHDTTATTIAWVLERITHHPAVLAELERTVRSGDDSYLDATIHETLRLRPIAPFTVRLTKEPLELDGLTVPAETIVVPYIALVHRRPDVYPEPDEFRPERFLGVRPGTYSWLPFGGGMRRCIGASMAMLEARVVLRTLIRELDLRPARPDAEAITRGSIFIVPSRGAELTATPAGA
jgi:cytochrome P450